MKLAKKPKYNKYEIQKAHYTALSKPKFITIPYEPKPLVPPAALRAKCTTRTKILSVPPPRQLESLKEKKQPKCKEVSKAALNCQPTQWIVNSAVPKLTCLNFTRSNFRKRLKERQRKALSKNCKIAKMTFDEQHPAQGVRTFRLVKGVPVHIACFKGVISDKKPTYICQLPIKKRKVFLLRNIRRALPIPKPDPPRPPRGPKVKIAELQRTLGPLSVPVDRREDKSFDPFKVKPSALRFQTTDWINNMAKPKEVRPPPPVYDFRGNEILPPRVWDVEARKRVITTQRTAELAIPKIVKKKASQDVKDDPWAISRAALTYVCTERIAELALPVMKD